MWNFFILIRKALHELHMACVPKKMHREEGIFCKLDRADTLFVLSEDQLLEPIRLRWVLKIFLLSNFMVRQDGVFWKLKVYKNAKIPMQAVYINLNSAEQVKMALRELEKDLEFYYQNKDRPEFVYYPLASVNIWIEKLKNRKKHWDKSA